MVEKTQRAISILQQRQADAGSVRSAEEVVSDIQSKANMAILEVKQAALDEIRHMRQAKETGQLKLKSKEEVNTRSLLNVKFYNLNHFVCQACWNCGRLASETCSGCGVARYCGAFCQHKDWTEHSKSCRQKPTAPLQTSGENKSISEATQPLSPDDHDTRDSP